MASPLSSIRLWQVLLATALLALPAAAWCEGGGPGFRVTIRDGGGPAILPQETAQVWCPGSVGELTLGLGGEPGYVNQGQVTMSGVELLGPCLVTAGNGTCTVLDASTLTWTVIADASGWTEIEVRLLLPVGAPPSGQICFSASFTLTPPGQQPGEPLTFSGCGDYVCPPMPLLGREALAGLALLLAVAGVLVIGRRRA